MDFWKELSKPANANAFMSSFWASMGTFLGGLLVLLLVGLLGADPGSRGTAKVMGILQALSAGVMIFMTCFHLLPESTESVGSRQSMIYFFLGVIAFGVLEEVIIPHEKEEKASKKGKKSDGITEINQKDQFELYRTSLITFIAMALHNIPEGISVYLASLSNQKMVHIVHLGLSIGSGDHAS
jgi:ZIP family zinc transporter